MMSPTSVFPTMNLCGHTMVRSGDLWVSRAPFTNINWQSNADRLWADHKRYGVLTETRGNGEVRHDLQYLSSLATLRDTFGADKVGKDLGGSEIIWSDDFTVLAGEFFILKGLGMDRLRHPVIGVTYFHAQAMCLAIGADLMTDDQYVKIVSGRSGKREYATPNGELFGQNGEEYVVSSLKQKRQVQVDVEDPAFPTDPETGTRHYTGNVWKWTKRNPAESYKFGLRGGSWNNDNPKIFAASSRINDDPDSFPVDVGFLAALPA